MAMMMMDSQQEPFAAQLSSTYPSAPMEYVNMYTNENVKMGKAPPPPKILKESYTSFGKPIDPNDVLIRSLESQGIERLYSKSINKSSIKEETHEETSKQTTYINTNNHKKELKKLNHSILIAYLDLLEILVKAPNTQIEIEQPRPRLPGEAEGEATASDEPPIVIIKTLRQQKLEDIEMLFINMHHLINDLRPHQARDNIRCILEMQKQQRIEIAAKFRSHLYKIVNLLTTCIQSVQSSPSSLNDEQTFIDELNTLISSAKHLTKSLEKFNHNSNTINQLDQHTTNGLTTHTDDIEMKCEYSEPVPNHDDHNHNNLHVANNNILNNQYKSNRAKSKHSNDNNEPDESILLSDDLNNNANQISNLKNCDFKDLILCNLIDEFLIKENEF